MLVSFNLHYIVWSFEICSGSQSCELNLLSILLVVYAYTGVIAKPNTQKYSCCKLAKHHCRLAVYLTPVGYEPHMLKKCLCAEESYVGSHSGLHSKTLSPNRNLCIHSYCYAKKGSKFSGSLKIALLD